MAETKRTSIGRGAAGADAEHLPLLEDAEQLDLDRHGQVADLVEEDGAALGRLEEARAGLERPGERALLVAEELALEEGLGEGRAVDREERAPRPRRGAVEGAGQHVLADARLAEDEDREEPLRGAAGLLVEGAHGGLAHDNVVVAGRGLGGGRRRRAAHHGDGRAEVDAIPDGERGALPGEAAQDEGGAALPALGGAGEVGAVGAAENPQSPGAGRRG